MNRRNHRDISSQNHRLPVTIMWTHICYLPSPFFVCYILKVRPNSVVLELCKERRNILEVSEDTVRDRSRDLNWEGIRRIMKKEGTVAGLTQVLFIKISAKMMDKLGIVPGGEFRAGFIEGQRNRCTVYLGDREMRVTLKRALNSLPIWQQFKFMKLLTSSMLFDMDISLEEVEKMKNADMLEIFTGGLVEYYYTATDVGHGQ